MRSLWSVCSVCDGGIFVAFFFCLKKVYYIKNTSLGLRYSGLGPVWPPPLGSGTTQNTWKWQRWSRQLGFWLSPPCWQTVHGERPCLNVLSWAEAAGALWSQGTLLLMEEGARGELCQCPARARYTVCTGNVC